MIKEVEKILSAKGISEASAEAKLIVTSVSGLTVEEILLGKKIENRDVILALAEKRAKTGAPVQYIIGFAYFMGDKFKVTPDVLIPRPETELLVKSAVDEIKSLNSARDNSSQGTQNPAQQGMANPENATLTETGTKNLENNATQGAKNAKNPVQAAQGTVNVLDIGTGTGCIALEIAKNLPDIDIEVMGTDISTSAIRVAIDNMNALNQERRVIFRKSDIFSGLRPIDKFDIIVSNPPYIPLHTKNTLQNEVKNFEPQTALFAEDELGITFYDKILQGAKAHLKHKFSPVLFEIGLGQRRAIENIAQKYGFKLKYCLKDLSEIERVLAFEQI